MNSITRLVSPLNPSHTHDIPSIFGVPIGSRGSSPFRQGANIAEGVANSSTLSWRVRERNHGDLWSQTPGYKNDAPSTLW